jgi:hypothetical protein
MKLLKEEESSNLLDSSFGDIPPPKKIDDDKAELIPHFKREITINLVYD